MYYIKIFDANNIPRAWAQGSTVEEVVQEAVNAAVEHVLRRPDCAPYRVSRDVYWEDGDAAIVIIEGQ